MYVDPEVLRHEVVAFAAGSQTESVTMRTDALFGGERVTAVPLCKQPDRGSDDPVAQRRVAQAVADRQRPG